MQQGSICMGLDKSGLILVLLLSVLFLGEPLTMQVVAGTALVLAGILV
jgi:bacterial/archaeal transporter family protein